jgi:(p)ppGpp synthase/HD superfamily hydrolase
MQTRRKDSGLNGNGGQYASMTHNEADTEALKVAARPDREVSAKTERLLNQVETSDFLSSTPHHDAREQYEDILRSLRHSDVPEADVEKVLVAMGVAWLLHEGQHRKSTDVAYITHPLSNVQRLVSYGVTDPDVLAAAALHDCVEDCSHNFASERQPGAVEDEHNDRAQMQQAIDETFGKETGDIVAAVSNEPGDQRGMSTSQKNAAYVSHASEQIHANFGAFMVKWADYLDNAGTLREAQFADSARKVRLARKYAPLADEFKNALAHHEARGASKMPDAGASLFRSDLERIQSDLDGILA